MSITSMLRNSIQDVTAGNDEKRDKAIFNAKLVQLAGKVALVAGCSIAVLGAVLAFKGLAGLGVAYMFLGVFYRSYWTRHFDDSEKL